MGFGGRLAALARAAPCFGTSGAALDAHLDVYGPEGLLFLTFELEMIRLLFFMSGCGLC